MVDLKLGAIDARAICDEKMGNDSVRLRELILKRFQDRGQPAGMMDDGVRVETDRILAVVRCTNTHDANLGMSPES
jgi:hypothetical protein